MVVVIPAVVSIILPEVFKSLCSKNVRAAFCAGESTVFCK